MKVGDNASITRSYTAADTAALTALAGVEVVVDGLVPEPLVGGLFSYLLGRELPGFGTNYLKQEMRFLRPVLVGEPVTATVEITRIRPEKHLVDLATTCTDASGEVLCEGRALVLVKDVGHRTNDKQQGSDTA